MLLVDKFYIGIMFDKFSDKKVGDLKLDYLPKKIYVNFVFGPNVHKTELLKNMLSLD